MTTTTSPSDPTPARRSGSSRSNPLGGTGKIAKLLKRHNAQAFESSSTSEQATAFLQKRYDDTGRLPGRRFRVEAGSLTSRFLTKMAAEATVKKYGGEIIELVTAKPRVSKAERLLKAAKGAPECRACGALAGLPCRHGASRGRAVREMHRVRVRDIAAAAAGAPPDGGATPF